MSNPRRTVLEILKNDDLPKLPQTANENSHHAAETPKRDSQARPASLLGHPSQWLQPRNFGYDVEQMNAEFGLVLAGSQAFVVRFQPAAPFHDRLRFLSIGAFNTWLANQFTETIDVKGHLKYVTFARRWLADPGRRQYEGIEFFPNPDGQEGSPGYLNLWQGFSVQPAKEGSYSIFRDHLFTNVCQQEQALFEYVFGWFAHLFQRPRERIGTSLVLRGGMGTGKSKVGEVFGSLIQPHYFQVDDPRYITGQFNAHMASCLLLQAEEAIWAGDKTAEGRLKGLVTSDSQMLEQKGIDPIHIKNYVRLLMTSNESWVVPAGKDERRFCVIDVGNGCAQNHNYFKEMDEELARGGREKLLSDLLEFDLSGINLRQIPHTVALREQKLKSMESIDKWWLDKLTDGHQTRESQDWAEYLPKEAVYSDYLRSAQDIGTRYRLTRSEFGVKLRNLCPGLGDRRPRLQSEKGEVKPTYCYTFPPLEECRASFEDSFGQSFEWPSNQPSHGGHAAASDEVPF